MSKVNNILIGGSKKGKRISLLPKMANRHGLIAGATGTGKTVTLQVLAEQFSELGVSVFTADIKGDLSGLAAPGVANEEIARRIDLIGIDNFSPDSSPILFWDLFAKSGHPVRTTISEMGPLMISRLLRLNETQQDILEMTFRVADDQGMLLLDLKDLREMIAWMGNHRKELATEFGNISTASIGAIQRRLFSLDTSGGNLYFGEPSLRLNDFMRHDFSGRGVISLLDGKQLLKDSRLYTTFLLWLLSELFEELDEVGDLELPRLIFFFDEAHLLFRQSHPVLIEKIETVVRLIRSKGVGVYFVTQHPSDIPQQILAQLGNRILHSLRAYTPSQRKAIKAVAESFRPNPAFDTEKAITELSVGEALVSVLDEKGTPSIVEKTLICPPRSQIGGVSAKERETIFQNSPIGGIYDKVIDRQSAYEIIKDRRKQESASLKDPKHAEASEKLSKRSGHSSRRQSSTEAFFKSVLRSIGSSLGRTIARGILGSILGKAR